MNQNQIMGLRWHFMFILFFPLLIVLFLGVFLGYFPLIDNDIVFFGSLMPYIIILIYGLIKSGHNRFFLNIIVYSIIWLLFIFLSWIFNLPLRSFYFLFLSLDLLIRLVYYFISLFNLSMLHSENLDGQNFTKVFFGISLELSITNAVGTLFFLPLVAEIPLINNPFFMVV